MEMIEEIILLFSSKDVTFRLFSVAKSHRRVKPIKVTSYDFNHTHTHIHFDI